MSRWCRTDQSEVPSPHTGRAVRISSISTGFSLMEVMVSVLILAIAMTSALSSMSTVEQNRRGLDYDERATLVLQLVVGKLRNTGWGDLGQVDIAKHRRVVPSALSPEVVTDANGATVTLPNPANPPLTEKDLISSSVGVLNTAIGLPGLQVYVEYYRMGIYDRLNDLNNQGMDSRTAWKALVGGYRLPKQIPSTIPPPTDVLAKDLVLWQGTNNLRLAALITGKGNRGRAGANPPVANTMDDGVLVRVVVSWIPAGYQGRDDNYQAPRQWREQVIGLRP